jgi:hypothetical protein
MKYYTFTAFVGKNGGTGVQPNEDKYLTKEAAAEEALAYLEERNHEHVDSMARDGNSVTVEERDDQDDEHIVTCAEYYWSYDWHNDGDERTWAIVGG